MKSPIKPITLINDILIFTRDIILGLLSMNSSRSAGVLRRRLYKTDCFIDTGVLIVNPKNFFAQRNTILHHGCYVLNTNGKFIMGANSHLGSFCYVNVFYGSVSIGEDVAIGPGTKIFSYSNHFEKGKKITNVRITNNVEIGNNVFIGANCSILPGTIIRDNVVVGAGSVIKGELQANSIYAGVPCKLIKRGWYESL